MHIPYVFDQFGFAEHDACDHIEVFPDTFRRSQPKTVIYLITTGGTIEKDYSEREGAVANFEGKIERYLNLLRLPSLDVRIMPLLNKDSLEMTAEDRELLLDTVCGLLREHSPIVITHGTDTMAESGLHLHVNLNNLSVPIVMTGAMTPLGFERSDGLQNLTESLFAVRMLPPGVFTVMHNQVFPITRVRKDRALQQFVPR